MNQVHKLYDQDVSNPLDSIEDALNQKQWVFTRPGTDELIMHVKGDTGQYIMSFVWYDDLSALTFKCECDIDIPKARLDTARKSLARINEDLWMGHFDVPRTTGRPCFRQTSLMQGWTQTSGSDHVLSLIEYALAICERHYNFFNVLGTTIHLPKDLVDLALIETRGKA